MWVKVSTMHCTVAAARWKQSIESQIRQTTWLVFSKMLLERFGGNEHELLLRRLFHVRKTGSIADYIEQFSGLIDQLTAYAPRPDPLYYTQHFIDGLRPDIKSVVFLQRPSTLNTACVLAQLQEEVSGDGDTQCAGMTHLLPPGLVQAGCCLFLHRSPGLVSGTRSVPLSRHQHILQSTSTATCVCTAVHKAYASAAPPNGLVITSAPIWSSSTLCKLFATCSLIMMRPVCILHHLLLILS